MTTSSTPESALTDALTAAPGNPPADTPELAPTAAPRVKWHPSPLGSLFGFALAVLSITPSLLPRPALLQGAIAALAFGAGYLVGVVAWALLRRLGVPSPHRKRTRRRWLLTYTVVWVLAVAGLSGLALTWQNEVRELVRMPPLESNNLLGFAIGYVPLVALLLAAGKGTRALFVRLRRRSGVLVSSLISGTVVAAALALLTVAAVTAVDRIYANANLGPDPSAVEPSSEFRSAGTGSAITWETLGRHGSVFVGGGPDATQIEALTGEPAKQPIRVYAGFETAPSLEERAALIVAELKRTGAFDRQYLVVATTTGSGWLEPQTVDAFEYLHSGDTAIASMQYAYTPSWVSFVFDPDAPVAAAQVLFAAIERELASIPEADQPQLLAYGLSLGAHGSQAVFSDLANVRARTDGALFVGSPNGSQLWQSLQASRDAGTPAWQPVLDGGREVRWMSAAGDESKLTGPWEAPRVLYLQHPTDPVTWLSPKLLWQAPEWLEPEQRSAEISPSMRWIPVVTALQMVVDMLGGEAVPATFGHNYGDVVVTAWQQVAGDDDLTPAAVARIQAEIESYAQIRPYSE